MQAFVQTVVSLLEYAGVFGLMMVVSSELVMPFAGYLAWQGYMSLTGVIIAGSLGSTFGSLIVYFFTRYVGHAPLYRTADRYGTWLGVSAANIRRTERWFDRHAKSSVLLGRFFPGIRTAVSLIAGYRHMPFPVFAFCTLLGSAAASAALASLGYFISRQYETVQTAAIIASNIVLSLLAAALIIWAIIRHRRSARKPRI